MTQQTLSEFEQTVRCPSCDREFESQKAMRIHHTKAHDESLVQRDDRYRCPECDREVDTERGLTNHMAKVHPETWNYIQSNGMVLELMIE